MRLEAGRVVLSASDLMRFAGCAHAASLDLARLRGEGPERAADSEEAALVQGRGDAHEAAHLSRLKAAGRRVVEIDRSDDFAAAAAATRVALAEGPDIVFQAALAGGAFAGWADFLERVERPSALGLFSYEVADTKLKRRPAPGHVHQLALYSELLAGLQGAAPERAHVELGDGKRWSFRLAEYAAAARALRDRLEGFVVAPPETRPIPVAACALCRWRLHCASVWKSEDSLFLTAGITRSQAAKLEAAGVATMAALAAREARVPRLAAPTLDRLRAQARLQHARKTGGPAFELRAPEPGRGFARLPAPDPDDLFYDIEGDPFWEEGPAQGLEYLHGVEGAEGFRALWAHDLAAEKQALEALFAGFEARLSRSPGAHVYHYAPYEITALRRLVMRHGTGEARLDRWLRERRFVDLYAVVRGALAASEPSYSIKDLEALYGFERTGEVKTAGGSVVAYERWRETSEQAILDEIEAYNRLDCVSTRRLRDWLLGIRPAGPFPDLRGEAETEVAAAKEAAADEEAEALRAALAAPDLPEARRRLLFDLAMFHRREAKPAAWAVFDAAGRDPADLAEDPDCLAGLVALGPAEPEKKSVKRAYRFPPQETKLRAGATAQIVLGEGLAGVEVLGLDRKARRAVLKLGPKDGRELPGRVDLLPNFALDARVIAAAIRDVIEDQRGARANRAADDLLARRAPRFVGPSPLPLAPGADAAAGLAAAALALDGSVLPVQGPPGTGKTWASARAILALVRAGRRVAVASNSHAAIRNVLMACLDAQRDDDPDFEFALAHKTGAGDEGPPAGYEAIASVVTNDDAGLREADVVGGTAWLFARPDFAGAFDTLLVDEAGQVSLANLIAMSRAARNLVLVGDPRQLPQVVQGAHPHPAGLSCLDWMLGEDATIRPERGIFLPETRRMRPELCDFVSNLFYEGRLAAHPSTEARRVEAPGLPHGGAWLLPVPHEGRAQECPEEIDAIRRTVARLLRGCWIDGPARRPLTAADLIVVAPYNAQTNALADALPGVRVGTVDRFQGQEAPVALVSMTASSAEETARGLAFLLSRERINVAVSRARALALVFASPALRAAHAATVEELRLVNALAALPVWRHDGG